MSTRSGPPGGFQRLTSRFNIGDNGTLDMHHEAKEFSQKYDYCIVFPMEADKTESAVAKHCIKEMIGAGLEIYPYLSVQEDELYVLIRTPV
jgi:hypothetical protein